METVMRLDDLYNKILVGEVAFFEWLGKRKQEDPNEVFDFDNGSFSNKSIACPLATWIASLGCNQGGISMRFLYNQEYPEERQTPLPAWAVQVQKEFIRIIENYERDLTYISTNEVIYITIDEVIDVVKKHILQG